MKCKIFFESLGNPKEFLQDFLNKLLEEIKKYERIEITSYNIAEPVEKEIGQDDKKMKLWSSFLEIEANFKDFDSLIDFILFYSPSYIEIEDIKEIKLEKEQINNILNSISHRIIQLSMIINDLKAQNTLLFKHLEKVAPRIANSLKQKSEFNFKIK